MNYNDEITNQLNNVSDPCGSAVPAGYYRRVKWELYNPGGTGNIEPGNGVEWETEVIDRNTHIWTSSPFGEQSTPFSEPTNTEDSTPSGIWCSKLGIYFETQTALTQYVSSIGATLLSNNDWYGADISKSSLYKTTFEKSMYLIENAGGTWTNNTPRINSKTMLSVDSNNTLSINFNCLEDHRVSYLKYYDTKPCTFVGLHTNTDVSVTLPGIPTVVLPTIAALDMSLTCMPVKLQFPYSGIYTAIIQAWNTSVTNAKLDFSKLPSLPNFSAWNLGTIYEHLSNKMEELGNGALAIAHEGQVAAAKVFKEIISQALNIVGGGWNVLKAFLPTITIAGISVDVEDFCMNGVNSFVQALMNSPLAQTIEQIYSAMGVDYDYATEYVKMEYRDLVDAVTEFYDWCWSQLFQAYVAISKFLTDMALKWTEPPKTPNPLWIIVKEVEDILSQINPLSIILSGNFPGFTSTDIYNYVKTEINQLISSTTAQIKQFKLQLITLNQQVINKSNSITSLEMQFTQYLAGVEEKITDELTAEKQAVINETKEEYQTLSNQVEQINTDINNLKENIQDLYTLGIEKIKNFTMISEINNFLSLAGVELDSLILQVKSNVNSMYKSYSDAMRQIKDTCKFIYSQIATLSLSKVTQWINMLLQIFGLKIEFPEIDLCIPIIKS